MGKSDWGTVGTTLTNGEVAAVKRLAEIEGHDNTSQFLRTLLLDYVIEKSTAEKENNDGAIVYDQIAKKFRRMK